MSEIETVLKNKGGRPKGAPNASTINARRAIADFVDDNVERLNGWLDAIAKGEKNEDGKVIRQPDPKAAFDCFMSVIEFHIPKLQRAETKIENTLSIRVSKESDSELLSRYGIQLIEGQCTPVTTGEKEHGKQEL